MIDKLGYLVALARERSFRRAAEACGVAQPTLSAAIRQLEEELDALLVLRSSRYHGLTPEGEKVLEWAKRMVGDARAMRRELADLRAGLVGHVRLAVIPTALAMAPALTVPCQRRHPGISFTVLSCSSVEILAMLDGLEADAGISYLGNEPLGRARAIPLYTERYRFVTAPGGPLSGRDGTTWAELAAVPLCLLTPDMQNRRIIDRLMRGAGAEPRPTLESNSVVALLAHVQTGQWASVLPESIATTLGAGAGLRALPVEEPAVSHEVGLILPDRDPMTALTAALAAEARGLEGRIRSGTPD
ncbi:MAG: LysR family transcriptional regulator [Proteobacteria bacterium]|nr:LysR family transcriptional regulator [Pseudomonadota bacterium]